MRKSALALSVVAFMLAACGDSNETNLGSNADNPNALSEAGPRVVEISSPRTAYEIRRSTGLPTEADYVAAATSKTFQEYIVWDRTWRNESVGDRDTMRGPSNVCAAMTDVGLSCWYHTRYLLSDYLAYNGANLFPCGPRSGNPWFATEEDCDNLRAWERDANDSYFVGSAEQNVRLARSIRQNAALFEDGNLTPEAAARWQVNGG